MPTRSASAVWNGSGKEGNGKLSTASTALNGAQYSYKTRFEDGIGTNPEELIAAAHAGCFSMKLSFVLGAKNFTPDSIETSAEITLADGKITGSQLKLKAKVPGISEQEFRDAAETAKTECPISKLLNTNITLEITEFKN
ncbi:MAG: OsmC family protein [Chitinophagaceae bacterium]|nr:OsmC family protein [Chitinophagaceae bacterium]